MTLILTLNPNPNPNQATARETAEDIEDARRRGETREARALGWNATWHNRSEGEQDLARPAANSSAAAAQEAPRANASAAQAAVTAQVGSNASLMERYFAEEGLLRSNDAP